MNAIRKIPAEWLYALVFGVVGFLSLKLGKPWLGPLDEHLYFYLGSAYISGLLLAMALSYGERLLRGVPGEQFWRRSSLAVGTPIALGLFFTYPVHPDYPLIRLIESLALCAVILTVLITVFLPVSGLLTARATGRALADTAGKWGPLIIYIAFAGICLATIRDHTPQAWDPVLLRMDASLGFSPSEALFHWKIERPWVAQMNGWGYPLLGIFTVAVAARIYAAGAIAQGRRYIFSLILVGTLGLGCYMLVPAIGPYYAFPELFERATPERTDATNAAREAALYGSRQIEASRSFTRNAMPSLHTAFSLMALAAAWSWRRRFFWFCLPIGALEILTALTTSEHYLVDIFAAVPFSVLCWWLADRGVRHTGPANEPLPPLAFHGMALLRVTLILFASLIVSVGMMWWWAWRAPISPWLAWTITLVATGLPTWAAMGAHRQEPNHGAVSSGVSPN